MAFSTKNAQSYYDNDKEDALWEWINNSGQGIMGFEFGEIPPECFEFCLSQYKRFGIPHYGELHEAIRVGASAALYFLDVINPYALFEGVSDVDQTNEWSTTTYRIFDLLEPSKRSYEPDPMSVESFMYKPGQAEETMAKFMGMPGLSALPNGHGQDIRSVLQGDYNDRDWCEESMSIDGLRALREVFSDVVDGARVVNNDRLTSYMELGAWAAYLWSIGPDSRSFRMFHHEAIALAVEYGECLIVEGQFISPKYYSKIDRPPQSCYHCGVQTWCVEHTLTNTHQSYICEACLNFDMPKNRFSNCGSKFCTLSACPNHPYHQLGRQGAFQSRRESGYLLDMAKQKIHPIKIGATSTPKQLGF